MGEDKDNMTWIIDKILQLVSFLIKRGRKNYCWTPTVAVKNEHPCTVIEKYPKTFAMENGDITSRMISGEEAFIQAVNFFVLTERRKYPIYSDDYGIEEAETIFIEKDEGEFMRQCANVADHLIDYFSEWIEAIYQIDRKKNILSIHMKVAGRAKTLKIPVEKPVRK